MRWSPYSADIAPAPEIPITIQNWAGLNTATTASQIADNESPDLLNIVLDAEGRPDKRFGYNRVYATSLGAGKINGMFYWKRKDGSTRFLIHHGTTLYTQTGSAQPVSTGFTTMANNRSVFFAFNDFVWIMDGTNYLRYNGTTVVTVASIAYVPTIFISTPPAGGGTFNEDINLLTPAFKQSFSGNGTAKDFQLALTNLDATAVSAVVNGTTIAEGANLTVNRTTGLCTFTTAPTTGTNNVIITAYKTQAGSANQIQQCVDFVVFGGSQDTRIFWFGNPNFPSYMYQSGLYDPSYAPANGFQKVGSDSNKIKKCMVQYDTCIILKEPDPNSPEIFNMSFQLTPDSNGVLRATFPIEPINYNTGCIAIDSVQLINNTPTWLNNDGVHQLIGSNVRDERNTQHISFKIDKSADENLVGLLDFSLTNLQNSVSVDFDKKYMLAVGGSSNTVFVFDYQLGVWLKWSNIPASCFVEIDGYLYFGSSATGLVYKFLKSSDSLNFRDDGVAINSYLKTKLMDCGDSQHLKSVMKLWYHLRPATLTSADISYVTDNYQSPVPLGLTSYVNLFDYSLWDYANFTYILSSFPQSTMNKIKAKKFMYLQLIVSNPRIDESMGLLLLRFNAAVIKEDK